MRRVAVIGWISLSLRNGGQSSIGLRSWMGQAYGGTLQKKTEKWMLKEK